MDRIYQEINEGNPCWKLKLGINEIKWVEYTKELMKEIPVGNV